MTQVTRELATTAEVLAALRDGQWSAGQCCRLVYRKLSGERWRNFGEYEVIDSARMLDGDEADERSAQLRIHVRSAHASASEHDHGVESFGEFYWVAHLRGSVLTELHSVADPYVTLCRLSDVERRLANAEKLAHQLATVVAALERSVDGHRFDAGATDVAALAGKLATFRRQYHAEALRQHAIRTVTP